MPLIRNALALLVKAPGLSQATRKLVLKWGKPERARYRLQHLWRSAASVLGKPASKTTARALWLKRTNVNVIEPRE